MPLQKPQGIPLKPRRPVGSFHLSFADDVDLDASDSLPTTPSNPLPVDPVYQEGRLWCWAACMAMVLQYYHNPVSQCAIVKAKYGTAVDCSRPYEEKEESCNPADMEAAWKLFAINSVEPHVGLIDDPARVSFVDIKKELQAGKPVEAGLMWYGGGGHAIIIKGWSTSSTPEILWINDPLHKSILGGKFAGGQGLISYGELAEAFGNGAWTHTWTGLG